MTAAVVERSSLPTLVTAAVIVLLTIGACVMPQGSLPPTVPPPDGTSSPTPPTSDQPSSTPAGTPTQTATAEPTCPATEFVTFVASERLTDARIVRGSGGDLVGFVLAPSPGSPMRPRLTVEAVEPPFSDGGSGLPLEVAGEHHVLLRFEGMLHVEDSGDLVYTGPNSQPGIGGPVQQVELTEAFESYVSFIVGYDGSGCVFLDVTPALVTLLVEDR